MYSLQNIDLYFGSLHLLDNVSMVISPGEKAALIGKNGAGKTTLFKIINNEITPDAGQVVIPSNTTIGYLSQHFDFDENKTIREICLDVFKEYFDLDEEINRLHLKLETEKSESTINDILEKVSTLEIKKTSMAQDNPLAETSKILKGFGFKEEQFDDVVSTLSGGWKMRVQMSKLLLMKPDLLLLDEPDNHLDIEALIWFEKYLKNYSGAVLFISHDTEFMGNVANKIFDLSNKRVFDFKGTYKRYLDAKAIRQEKELQAFTNQQKVIKEKERTITRFMAKATKTKMAQSMQKQLDKMDRIEIEIEDTTQININFPTTQDPGKIVVKIDNVYKAYDDNSVIEDVSIVIERGQKVAFIGQNGQGKSTLVKMIADVFPPNKGEITLGHNVIVNYFAQNQSDFLDNKLTVLETIEKEADPDFFTKCRKTLGAFAFSGDDVHKKVSVLSGGEKSRLAMACLVSKKSNFLILDEPTNHLDIHSKAILKKAVLEYPGTLIIVSHDREILRGSVDVTYEFRDKKTIQHLGDLDYVLEKRNTSTIREFEKAQNSEKGSTVKSNEAAVMSYNERKQINRNISKTEKEIDKLEKKIKGIHDKLLDPSFYNSPDSADALKSLKTYEQKLETQTEEWEKWVNKLDA
ncbi:MAG: ABC-F family ATP-binding cassette domain-containing protein [Bacteroidia bacterium]|nr:ABC-F family ATP-binding cassette domain-containing protein [Bacteroidia bacterium]